MIHKHIITYEEDDVFSEHEFIRMIKATYAYLALDEILELFRQEIRYGDLPEEQEELLERMRTDILDILDKRCINLENELD